MLQKVKIIEFKCLKDYEADINGRNILLMGDNEVGKSSFTQFIKIALGDNKHIPENTKGKGTVVIDKEGKQWTFNVSVDNGKSKVEIVSPEGLKDSRKGSLSTLIGAVDFDINEFVELSKSVAGRKKQVEIFKGFLDEDSRTGIATLEANIQANYNERSDVNKTIKNMEGEIAGHPLNHLHDLSQIKAIDTNEVYRALQTANATNNKLKEIKSRYEERKTEIEKIKAEMDALLKKADSLGVLNEQAEKYMKENKEVPITDFESQINTATETNKKFEQAVLLAKKREQLLEAKEKSGDLTMLIDSQRSEIAEWIKGVSTPVEGLSFEGDTLLYNGVVVSSDSLSTSQIEELGIRLKIAENPEFGILFIGKAESIGKERMARILAIAKKHKLQVIGEQVERQDIKRLHIELINA